MARPDKSSTTLEGIMIPAPRTRTYAEQQADRAQEYLLRWIERTQTFGGPYNLSEAETFEFARIAKQIGFHAQREQVPRVVMTMTRVEYPVAHGAWEAFANSAWQQEMQDPDKATALAVQAWLDKAISVCGRRTKYYIQG